MFKRFPATRYFLSLLLFTGCLQGIAQSGPGPVRAIVSPRPNNTLLQELSLTDFNGKIFEKYATDILGTPYFKEEFLTTILVLHNGKKMDSVQSRIDLYGQEIDLMLTHNIKSVAGPGMIKEVLLVDSADWSKILYKFSSGFPAIDNQNENNYYLVLAEGKINLLKSIRKKIVDRKDDISGEITKDFETYEDYYLFYNKNMIRVKRNSQCYTDLMTDKKQEVATFLKEHPVNFKSPEKAVQLVNFYNSLP